MSIALALSAMVLLGSTHFINGVLARFYPPLNIAFYTHLGGALVAFLGALLFSTWEPNVWIWGALSGIGSALGAWLLYQGLSRAPFAIVVPVSAVAMVTIALGLSLVFLGERPNGWVWLGVMIALPAIWLTAGGGKPNKARMNSSTRAGLLLGLGAGLGFALQLHLLGQVPNQAAFYDIALCMLSGAVCCLPFYQHAHPVRKRFPLLATIAGGISALGLTLYALSRQDQLAIISIVIVSMYPLIPVVFGSLVRRERVSGASMVGIVLSIAAMMVIVAGSG
ncbi:DMT family transporter [Halomonas sp. ISL-60]|uniref:DMT family transporter n=1 Tax=Halomonas sp. ISL-56 TaxID=2819149 RepID=UPI001BEACD02|nr:DMT family transporter [Halomonas sp. ISL-56]MBT2772025.1 DMT family transporter [Halomonas sp. ISL-60]MBT2800518.1 DMT family transporter [Halomonas sp. ISL-56]